MEATTMTTATGVMITTVTESENDENSSTPETCSNKVSADCTSQLQIGLLFVAFSLLLNYLCTSRPL